MVEEDHYRIFLVITAQQRKRFQHSWQKFPSSKLCRWVTGFQKVYQSEMNWIKDNLQCEILLEKGVPLLPELKLSWIEKRQLMFVLTAVQSERCVCACWGTTHMVTMWHDPQPDERKLSNISSSVVQIPLQPNWRAWQMPASPSSPHWFRRQSTPFDHLHAVVFIYS